MAADEVPLAAKSIVASILSCDFESLKLIVTTSGNSHMWRQTFQYELPIEEMIDVGGLLQHNIVVPKLVVWETNFISGFHLAAVCGADEVLRLCAEQLEMSVEMHLSGSGLTILQAACFAGQLDTAKMLIDELSCSVNVTDNYGWTSLHYASVEGHFAVAELLIQRGCDVTARDRDGTSAAFRAQCAGHLDVVSLLASAVADNLEPLLSISSTNSDVSAAAKTVERSVQLEPIYATVIKSQEVVTAAVPNLSADGQQSSRTERLRRVIGEQIIDVLGEKNPYYNDDPTYLLPVNSRGQSSHDHDGTSTERSKPTAVSYDTLTRVVREELERYKQQLMNKRAAAATGRGQRPQMPEPTATNRGGQETDSGIYDYIWDETAVASEHHAFSEEDSAAVAGPPLPPARRDHRPLSSSNLVSTLVADSNPTLFQTLKRIEHSAAVMDNCFRTIINGGLKASDDWKRLGKALPVCSGSADRVDRKLKAIEQLHEGDRQRQALEVLIEWRKWRGEKAHVEALITSLRQCGLTKEAEMITSFKLESNA